MNGTDGAEGWSWLEASVEPKLVAAGILANPVLRGLRSDRLMELIAESRLLRMQPGATRLVGHPSWCLLILSGSMAREGGACSAGLLRAGDFLAGGERWYPVTATVGLAMRAATLERLYRDRPPDDDSGAHRSALRRAAQVMVAAHDAFAELDPEVRGGVLERCGLLEVCPSERVVREGERSTAVYLVLDGVLEESSSRGISTTTVRMRTTLERGDLFGHRELVGDRRCPATVTAVTRVRLVVFPCSLICELATSAPALYERLLLREQFRAVGSGPLPRPIEPAVSDGWKLV